MTDHADNLRTFWKAFWKAECEAAKASRDAACHERDATIEALEKAERERDAAKNAEDHWWKEVQATRELLQQAEATTRRLADELAAGWDAETVKRQVADFNALCDAVRHHKEEARRLEDELAVTAQERDAWMKEWARKGDRADKAKVEARRLREALEELRECCNPPGVPNITVVRDIINAALAGTEAQ